MEHIGNLTSKQGEDNEKLISKTLKRGDKPSLGEAKEEDGPADSDLHYDLTLPLSCYYANNAANLSSPLKAFQMGSVWRADYPQKDRFRQSAQCDIDILGDATSLAGIELTLIITTTLGRIRLDNGLTVRINGRGILRGMTLYCSLTEESMDQVFITLDKMDKIGYEGVEKELLEFGCCPESTSKYLDMLENVTKDSAGVRALGQMFSEVMPVNTSEGLARITDTVAEVTEADFGLEFGPTLVGGMLYYTGAIFEVSMEGSGGSVAGGDRYDKMVGKFTGMETPACGFPTGFERIVTILMDNGFTVPDVPASKAFLFERGVDSARLAAVICETMEERKKDIRVLIVQMNKNRKFQKEQLDREGYMEFKESHEESPKS